MSKRCTATLARIDAVAAELNVRFPADYVQFMCESDGALVEEADGRRPLVPES